MERAEKPMGNNGAVMDSTGEFTLLPDSSLLASLQSVINAAARLNYRL